MNFFRTLFSVCVAFPNYRTVRDTPLAAALFFVVRLLALLVLLLLASVVPWLVRRGNEATAWLDKNLPAFSIKDGQIVTEVKQPYRAATDDFLFVLDTTGQVTAPDPAALQGVLVMRDRLLMWFRPANTPPDFLRSREQSLRGFPDGPVNADYVRLLLRSFLWVGLPLTALFVLAGWAILTFAQACFFALVGSALERGTTVPLNFPQLLNVALHASAPAAIVVTLYLALRLEGIDLWLIYLVTYGIFLVGGTHACRDGAAVEDSREDDLL